MFFEELNMSLYWVSNSSRGFNTRFKSASFAYSPILHVISVSCFSVPPDIIILRSPRCDRPYHCNACYMSHLVICSVQTTQIYGKVLGASVIYRRAALIGYIVFDNMYLGASSVRSTIAERLFAVGLNSLPPITAARSIQCGLTYLFSPSI
ncbi:hypothetical protein VN97_g6708 [Penicillium thymicola]|uniref:Uncharacterized protein n=1 Tax=Penicillium thymicola TaxID=293382 RepID=A0AAI9X7S6_PENTH|nr:hypothetical protein VN97_g6708 [Penicillium thymicola]